MRGISFVAQNLNAPEHFRASPFLPFPPPSFLYPQFKLSATNLSSHGQFVAALRQCSPSATPHHIRVREHQPVSKTVSKRIPLPPPRKRRTAKIRGDQTLQPNKLYSPPRARTHSSLRIPINLGPLQRAPLPTPAKANPCEKLSHCPRGGGPASPPPGPTPPPAGAEVISVCNCSSALSCCPDIL